ncbi:type II secretion system minor pseudopilin GspK [Thiosulfativibrio zosterae]|nr:type II secretion system minor pseudopilin GspK [Thiosulfativibrio zosterae]
MICKHQQGFALMTVMLVVALVSIIVSQLLYQQHLDILRSQNRLNQAQAMAVANGLEVWVKKGLSLDAQANKFDHLNEQWAQPMPPIPFGGGQISGFLTDQQGHLNLNNVMEKDEAKRKVWQAILQRYFERKSLAPDLSDVVTDWVDADNTISPMGAESETYLLNQPPYRTANQPLVLVQELRLLKGFDDQAMQLLQEEVATLPEVTQINVNTAPAGVLIALADWMTPELAKAWEDERQLNPVEQVADFRKFMVDQTQFEVEEVNKDLPDTVLTTQSNYFLLQGQISFGVADQALSAILYRGADKQVSLVQRWFGVLETPQPPTDNTTPEE